MKLPLTPRTAPTTSPRTAHPRVTGPIPSPVPEVAMRATAPARSKRMAQA